MLSENNDLPEVCENCGAMGYSYEVDEERWLACKICGMQMENIEPFEKTLQFNTSENENSGGGSGRGDKARVGDKLLGSIMGGNRDYYGKSVNSKWTKRGPILSKIDRHDRLQLEGTPARRATLRMIKDQCKEYSSILEVALNFFNLGWPEAKKYGKNFITTAKAAHPHGRAATTAACIILAGEEIGIKIDRNEVLTKAFSLDDIEINKANRFTFRAIKCLRPHIEFVNKGLKQKSKTSKLDAILIYARDRDIRIGKIELKVRDLCIKWGDASNPRLFDSPKNYAACVVYEISKKEKLGMKIEDIKKAFSTSAAFREHSKDVRHLLRGK